MAHVWNLPWLTWLSMKIEHGRQGHISYWENNNISRKGKHENKIGLIFWIGAKSPDTIQKCFLQYQCCRSFILCNVPQPRSHLKGSDRDTWLVCLIKVVNYYSLCKQLSIFLWISEKYLLITLCKLPRWSRESVWLLCQERENQNRKARKFSMARKNIFLHNVALAFLDSSV